MSPLLIPEIRLINGAEMLDCFLGFFYSLTVVEHRLEQKEKHSILIDLETYNFHWRFHLITKADLL